VNIILFLCVIVSIDYCSGSHRPQDVFGARQTAPTLVVWLTLLPHAQIAELHEEKNADGKSVRALKMLAKRKYSAKADKGTANYKCPNCSNFYFYATRLP
jgi:hypothetical protein